MDKFIHLKSTKFPILPGEEEELVNEGTYGKALALYLQSALKTRGYDVPFVCCEDWGWWVELRGQPFAFGVCVYGSSSLMTDHELCVTTSATGRRVWSWRRFRFVDTRPWDSKLYSDLNEILGSDPEITILGHPDQYPLS